MNPMAIPQSYPAYPAQSYPVPQQAVRQPAPQQAYQQRSQPTAMRGGSIYLPPVRDVLNAPKPPPFGRSELAAQPATATGGMIARGQSPGDGAAIAPPAELQAKVDMPSREELGLLTANRVASEPAMDWGSARQQLDRWQATNYRLEKTADGQYRFVCALPYPGQPGRGRQFEATAVSESEALKLALDQAGAWVRTQR